MWQRHYIHIHVGVKVKHVFFLKMKWRHCGFKVTDFFTSILTNKHFQGSVRVNDHSIIQHACVLAKTRGRRYQPNSKEKVVRSESSTLLGVFIGEMAIFLPGRLCKLAAWGSVRVIVLGGITGEFWVRTLPKDIASKSLAKAVQKYLTITERTVQWKSLVSNTRYIT